MPKLHLNERIKLEPEEIERLKHDLRDDTDINFFIEDIEKMLYEAFNLGRSYELVSSTLVMASREMLGGKG